MAEMNEPSALSLPPSADPLEPPEPQPEPRPDSRQEPRAAIAIAVALACLLAVVVGGFWMWRSNRALAGRLQQVELAQQAADPARLPQLDAQVAALRDAVTKLEARPQPAPPPPAPPPVDLKPVEDRIAALEQRPAPVVPDQSAITGKVQALLGQLDGLAQQVQAAQAAAKTAQDQAAAAQGQATAAQGQASSAQAQTSAAADRVGQAQRLQVAAAALNEGRPLGEIAGAPPALTRFATTTPPTEAALRLAFPAAARQAAEASRPSLAGESLAARMWTRAQSLVTVKQGGRVLVGAPAAATLAQAQQRLDAGDLDGTLHSLQALDPAAAAAMAPWREQAQALVDARAALAATGAALAHR